MQTFALQIIRKFYSQIRKTPLKYLSFGEFKLAVATAAKSLQLCPTLCNPIDGSPPVFLPGESQGWQSLVGCRLWGRTESDTTEAI